MQWCCFTLNSCQVKAYTLFKYTFRSVFILDIYLAYFKGLYYYNLRLIMLEVRTVIYIYIYIECVGHWQCFDCLQPYINLVIVLLKIYFRHWDCGRDRGICGRPAPRNRREKETFYWWAPDPMAEDPEAHHGQHPCSFCSKGVRSGRWLVVMF